MDGDPSAALDKVGANKDQAGPDRAAGERIFVTEQTSDALIAAYGHNLASRLPMIYCVVLVNIVSLAFFFHGAAPEYLTTWLPACFVAAAGARALYWMPANAKRRTFAQVKRSVIWLPLTGVVLSLGLAAWALTLYGYGNETQQSLVQYASAITCFTGVLGMTHSPATAIMMATCVTVPSSVVFLLHDSPTRYPIVGLQIVVSVLLS
jgi:predicted signal transduction protein with EAL and GGDEF domain